MKNDLEDRDGKASFQFMYDDGDNPFNVADMSIVDYGVSDNIYSLSCELFQKTFDENKTLQSKLDDALSLAVKLLDIVSNTDAVYPDELEDMGQELRHIKRRVGTGMKDRTGMVYIGKDRKIEKVVWDD